MMEFEEWCEAADEVVNGHDLKVLSGSHDHLVAARDKVAEIVPTHYASEEHVAHVLEPLGKGAAAEFVRQKLPESKAVRSGDLGEILATEYIAENTPYEVPIKPAVERSSQHGYEGRWRYRNRTESRKSTTEIS